MLQTPSLGPQAPSRRALLGMSYGLLTVSGSDSLLRNHVCDFTKLKFVGDCHISALSLARMYS